MQEFRWSYVNPYTILKDLLTNLWVVLLCAAIAWMGTQVVLENFHQPEYTSAAVYYIAPKDSAMPVYSNIAMGYQMAGVLSTIFESDILAEKTAAAIGLAKLPASVKASMVEYTNLLRLQAVAATPEDAFLTVQALMQTHPLVSDYVVNNAVAEVLDSPIVPSSPSNFILLRKTQRNAAALGTFLAIVVLVIFSVLRDTVKTEDAVRELVDAPLYGTLKLVVKNKTFRSKLKRLNKSLLISNPVMSFSYTEAIRQICTKLEYAASDRGLKTILIASASENEGKSTIATNLALGLAKRGHSVLLFDGDLKRPAVYKLLKQSDNTSKDFSEHLRGEDSLGDVLTRDEKTGLYLLINRKSSCDSAELLSSQKMVDLMNTVSGMMDFVIVDSPPLALVADAEIMSSLCSAALLVIRQDISYIHTINDAIDKLNENTKMLGCVFNRSRTLALPGGSKGQKHGNYFNKARGTV